MSAIAGIIDFSGKEIPEHKISLIEEVSSNFRTDRTDTYSEPGLFFSCSHQYFTNEAVNDVSPITDDEKNVIFNADIFLYNRKELIEKLARDTELTPSEISSKGDCELAFLVYMHYGIDFVNILNGAYSIVIRDKREHCVYIVTDYVSCRHIAYSVTDGMLYYSTTLHVISALMEEKLAIDEEWLCASYMDFTPDTEKRPGKSAYKGVYRVEPGHYLKISLPDTGSGTDPVNIDNVVYWDPRKNIKKIKLSSDEEYGKLFRNTFINSVKRMLRARNRYGVLLSGGLDSSAVASVAAMELAKSDTKLYSYTQVPCSDYKFDTSVLHRENETEAVLYHKKKYPNIECKFITSGDHTPFSDPEKYIKRFAQPVKPIINSCYFYSIDEEIKNDGISIVFNGGTGNSTISYGNITSYVCQKNRQLHFMRSFREASAFCRLYGVSKPRLLKFYFSSKINKFKKIDTPNFIKPEFKDRYKLDKMLNKHFSRTGGGDADTWREWKGFVFRPLQIQHMAYHYTCQSLFTGAISLDPTMTKDVIELCMGLPVDCFVRNGKERRAVRDYLKGIVCDEVLDNLFFFGVQASDFTFRSNKYWDEIKDSLYANLNAKELDEYLERQKIEKLIEEIKEKEYNNEKPTLNTAALLNTLGCYLRNYKKYIEVDKWTKTVK